MQTGSVLTYRELAVEVLRQVARPLTVDEIWHHANDLSFVSRLRSVGKTPSATLAAQIYVSLANDPETPFVKLGRRPVRFFLKELTADTANAELQKEALRPEEIARSRLRERDAHPLLAYFAYVHLGVYCKTIRHERSSKSSKSEWLHPDLAGLFLPVDEWETSTLNLCREIGATVARLYAFEVKIEVNFGNLREAFFQAVSNASWANEGYLAALHLSTDPEFESELKRLSDAFGIGILKLDPEEPDASEILYRSRTRTGLDWETINKLAGLNPDFTSFMDAVRDSLKIHRINPADFDEIPKDAEKLAEQLRPRR